MAKFNTKDKATKVKSYEGGPVYKKDPLDDFIGFIFSSYCEDTFYEDYNKQQERYDKLLEQIANTYGYEMVAKVAVYARNVMGIRSIAQYTAAYLNDKTFYNKRAFYRNFCTRPDDVSEMFASVPYKSYSHAMVRGCGDYLSSLNEYSLGKYKMKGRMYNIYDLVNLTHAHSSAIDKLMRGELEAPDTWEVNISTAGDAKSRNAEWVRMVKEGRLGYMALIRNLNNILNVGVDSDFIYDYLIPQLIDADKIFKSKVFPYRIYTAYKNLKVKNIAVISALESAFRTSCVNMPKLAGNSIILLDTSGSMQSKVSYHSVISFAEMGACYAAALYLTQDADFMKFATYATRIHLNKMDNCFSIIEKMIAEDGVGYGTDISKAFEKMRCRYNNIFVISDCQIMNSNDWRCKDNMYSYETYCQKYGATKLYSFDLCNYEGTLALSRNPNVHMFAGLNDQIFKFVADISYGKSILDEVVRRVSADYRIID